MTKLLTVTALRQRIGFDSNTIINNALGAALESATTTLEAYLRTPFARASRVDNYYPLLEMKNSGVPFHSFSLSAGFLTDAAVTFIYAGTVAELAEADGYTDVENPQIDRVKGLIEARGTGLLHKAVRITYTSGFEVGSGETAGVYTGIPDWLSTGAAEVALACLDRDAPQLRGGNNVPDWQSAMSSAKQALATHIRYHPLADKAL